MPRSLHEIAREIRADWKNMSPSAKPYWEAMLNLQDINDKYGTDDGRYVVNYFLANTGSWRGDVAKRVKAELKQMLSRRASDDLVVRIAMRHTAAIRPGDIPLDKPGYTTDGKVNYTHQVYLRPNPWSKGNLMVVFDGTGAMWGTDVFLRGSGPLYIDLAQGWYITNTDEVREEVRRTLEKVQHGGAITVGAPAPDAEPIFQAARNLRTAGSNQMRVRGALVSMLNAMAPFCDYIGESDVTARFQTLSRDLASRG